MDQDLRRLLADPVDHGPLLLIDELLYNPRRRVAYPIELGVPRLVAQYARPVDEREHARLVG